MLPVDLKKHGNTLTLWQSASKHGELSQKCVSGTSTYDRNVLLCTITLKCLGKLSEKLNLYLEKGSYGILSVGIESKHLKQKWAHSQFAPVISVLP